MKSKCVIILLILISINKLNYAGGGTRVGTNGASELLIPVGIKGIALGGAVIANSEGIDGIYWNPAALSKSLNISEVFGSYSNHIANIGIIYFATSYNLKEWGSFAVSIKSLSIGKIDVTSVENPDGTGQQITPAFFTTGLNYSKTLSDRINVGMTFNVVTEKISRVQATAYAVNLGLIYSDLIEIQGLNLGIVMKNLGPESKFEGSGLFVKAKSQNSVKESEFYKIETSEFELPSSFELGLSYKYIFDVTNSASLMFSFVNNNYFSDLYNAGVEYNFDDALFFRIGYSLAPQTDECIYGFSSGFGVNYQMENIKFGIDYSFRTRVYFGAENSVGIKMGF